jgi:hypothetical protein
MKKLLILAILLRLLIMPFFFHPDIKTYHFQASFLKQGVFNIYPYLIEHRQELPLKEEFVYFPLSYLFLGGYQYLAGPFLGSEFAGWLADASGRATEAPETFRYLFLLKLPYLFLDIFAGYLLMQLFGSRKNKKRIFSLWLFNPFTLILIYVFSNIDIIPVVLALLSLVAIKKKYPIVAAMVLALAVGFKAYPVLFLPFLLIKTEGWAEKLKSLAVFGLTSLAIILPFWSPAFVASSFASGLTNRILEASVAISGGEKILIVPAALIVLYIAGWFKKGLALWKYFFAALLLVIPFIHFHIQWLLWIAPFLAIAWVKQNKLSWLLLLMSVAAFMIPFLYNDKFMSVSLLTPISAWFSLIPTPFAIVQRLADPLLVQSIIHSALIGGSLVLIWEMLGGSKNEEV